MDSLHLIIKEQIDFVIKYQEILTHIQLISRGVIIESEIPLILTKAQKEIELICIEKLPSQLREKHQAFSEAFDSIKLNNINLSAIYKLAYELQKELACELNAIKDIFRPPPRPLSASLRKHRSKFTYSTYLEDENPEKSMSMPLHLTDGLQDRFFFILCMLKAGPELGKLLAYRPDARLCSEEGCVVWDLFSEDVVADKIHNAILEIAIKLRSLIEYYEQKSSVVKKNLGWEPLLEEPVGAWLTKKDNLFLKNACNKIIHGKEVCFEHYTHPFHPSGLGEEDQYCWIGDEMILIGSHQKTKWKVKINIIKFIAVSMRLL